MTILTYCGHDAHAYVCSYSYAKWKSELNACNWLP